MSVRDRIIEAFGWYGTFAVIGTYAAVSFGFLPPNGLLAAFLNGSGAVGIAAVSFRKKAYQPFVLNLVWLTVAVITALRAFFR